MKNNKTLRLIGNLLMVFSVVFIAKKFYDSRTLIGSIEWKKTIPLFTFASILYALIMGGFALCYQFLIKRLTGKSVNSINVIYLYLRSNLYKYLPGNVFHLIGRNQIAKDESLPHVQVAMITTLEIILQIITVLILVLLFSAEYLIQYLTRAIQFIGENKTMFLIAGIIILIAVFFFARKIRGKQILKALTFISVRTIPFLLVFILFYAVYFVGFGFIYILVLHQVGVNLPASLYMTTIGVYSFSWLIGFLTPGAPGGLGIREVVMAALLTGIASQDLIVVSATLTRLVSIIGDILAYILIIIIRKTKHHQTKINRDHSANL